MAYLRGENVITCVPRWNVLRAGRWGATSVNIPVGRWENILTGEEVTGGAVRAQILLRRFPGALLAKKAE